MDMAAAALSTPCPVAPMADEMIRLIRLRNLFETRSPELFDAAVERLMRLEDAIMLLRPRSARGAFVKLLVSLGPIDPHYNGNDDEAIDRLARAQDSLTGIAFALAGPGDDVLLDFYTLPRARLADELAA